MDCNHRPRVPDEGDAIWKRLKAVPFNVRIADADLDLQLPDKLRAEMPGILAWAVRGCIAWQKQGLGEPPEVSQANLEWREHDDPLKEFLEDCCTVDPDAYVGSRDLAAAYEWWAKQARERFPLGRENFGERMRAKGFISTRTREKDDEGGKSSQLRVWKGLELTVEMAAQIRKLTSQPRSWKGDEAE